jgi:hypothetical protein
VWKASSPQGFDPRTAQPVASRFTDSNMAGRRRNLNNFYTKLNLINIKNGIPYLNSKIFGLFRSREWKYIALLFDAAADPIFRLSSSKTNVTTPSLIEA